MDEDDRRIRDAYSEPIASEEAARARVIERLRRERVMHEPRANGRRWRRPRR
jgi:hypothetical protein